MPELVISRVNTLDYRMPLKRPYGTARGVTKSSKNFLVRLLAEYNGDRLAGVGESQPRHRLTGDISIDVAWGFLQTAAETLPGRALDITDALSAVESVRAVMSELAVLAQSKADERNAEKPFRGTLLGIEVALLDLVSRALGLPLSQVLGEQRDEVAITVSTLSTQNSPEAFRRKVGGQKRYPMVRVKGVGEFDKDTELLRIVHEANLAAGRTKNIWMDNNEGFDVDEAKRFITHIAEEISADRLPPVITIEQPIHKSVGDRLPELQALADELTIARGFGEIRIMPDESLWDVQDAHLVTGKHGCRALNIKTAKAGGLLASLDLAKKAVELKPEVNICIGGMVGTSDITTWSLISLAKTLPRIDYITAVPPGNVAKRISAPLTAFKDAESNVHADPGLPGIGGALDEEAVRSFVHRQAWFPKGSGPDDDPFGAEKRVTLHAPPKFHAGPDQVFRVLFMGDFHYGESYITGGGTVLPERGYADGTKYLKQFIDRADYTVANLETPVVDPKQIESPLEEKRFLHWSDPKCAPAALKDLGIDAVSLANNHTLDYGREGLKHSLQVLRRAGVEVFGAGKNLAAAQRPLHIGLPKGLGGGSIAVHGSMLGPKNSSSGFDPFAKESQSGCAPFSSTLAERPSGNGAAFHLEVAFPHWGPNYKWRTPRQRRAAQELLRDNADLIIGHGAHCLQEFGRYQGKWVAYGIGNSHFQAQGRFETFVAENGILPYSFWTMLTVEVESNGATRVFARFYPVYSDNKRTDFQPHPVVEEDFNQIVQVLYRRDAQHFETKNITGGADDLGLFLQIEIKRCEAPEPDSGPDISARVRAGLKKIPGVQRAVRKIRSRGGLPSQSSRQRPAVEEDSGLLSGPRRSTQEEPTGDARLLDLVKRGRTLGTQLIADRAAADGAEVQWYGGATCALAWEDKRILLQGNRATESSVGAGIIKDKYLTKTFLQKSGARSPEGYLASTAEEAVGILQRMGRPVVVKPRAGDRGRAVTVNVQEEQAARVAFERAENDASGGVLVEEYIKGVEYRCLVTQDECMSVVNRAQAYVVGDGRSTIEQLINDKNKIRRENPYLHKKLIPTDEDTARYLSQQDLRLNSVPEPGIEVFVRPVGNFSQGSDVVECSDTVSEDLKHTAVKAAQAIPGMTWAGVDVVVSSESGLAYVLEVNSNSGIGSHHFPMKGEAKDIAERIWKERRCRASADTTGEPQVPALREDPEYLGQSGSRLSDLLRSALTAELDYGVEHLGGGTYEVSKAGVPIEWLRGCSTTQDLSAVGAVLSRHGTVRRILEAEKVNLARGRRVRTHQDLAEFLTQIDGSVDIVGYLRGWGGARRQTFTAERVESAASLLRKSGSLVVQEHSQSSRFTVVCSRDAALLVLGQGDEQSVAQQHLGEVAELAVRAVRAVPELRRAAVDIAIVEEDGGDQVYVEGLSSDPLMSEGSAVLAGSLRSFAENVISR
ncbi:CapA family protein [Nesterenkonia alkaliphila]|uniref:ATP-grasp domain-containing protein n=1 Tax=Nesterenkonia alkaliphila TaxID=1463631 RepID=A0A7K1UKK7_9MICC|nr:CapA family protein [Nesterenkonia alkaliphila]MVT26999.1 ATP-grasp domain-containing protein [Nesterenkonia alkaliphila]GFZ96715.1 hypothetical protein GCM10011359_27710 [Nesterenkonia alkaliphila]